MIELSREQQKKKKRIEEITKNIRTLLKKENPISMKFLINFWTYNFMISKRTCKEYIELAAFKLKAKIVGDYITK